MQIGGSFVGAIHFPRFSQIREPLALKFEQLGELPAVCPGEVVNLFGPFVPASAIGDIVPALKFHVSDRMVNACGVRVLRQALDLAFLPSVTIVRVPKLAPAFALPTATARLAGKGPFKVR